MCRNQCLSVAVTVSLKDDFGQVCGGACDGKPRWISFTGPVRKPGPTKGFGSKEKALANAGALSNMHVMKNQDAFQHQSYY